MSSPGLNTSLLGYPETARLLIVNADDLGMCHSINVATIEAMRHGLVTTASLMTCCPWAWEAMQLLRDDSSLTFGIHLTLVNEMPGYRWGPVSSRDSVPSLVNSDGFFLAHRQIPELYARADAVEVEREFRAQIDRVLGFGLKPTHLDWHCVLDGGRPDILDLTLQLCDEYGLAMRVNDAVLRDRLLAAGKPANDTPIIDGYGLPLEEKNAIWARMLRELPAGLHQWAAHVSLGDAEAQAMEPHAWQVRKTDFDFFMSDMARSIVAEEGIVLIDYRAIQRLWTGETGAGGQSVE
ncbi:MAG: polysaccharide deacetylase family protein [Thermomicrobiales bacterium]|nr:polysaccharide deacetylase family protein [Thermomicrobiales bacterium]